MRPGDLIFRNHGYVWGSLRIFTNRPNRHTLMSKGFGDEGPMRSPDEIFIAISVIQGNGDMPVYAVGNSSVGWVYQSKFTTVTI